MSSRWTGFFIWALVAACGAFWGLKIFAATRPLPPGTQTPAVAVAAAGPMERLFGAIVVPVAQVNAPPAASTRFQLVGVIAPRAGSNDPGGLAIVSVDSQPAKAWHVGAKVDGDTALLAVTRRTADFGPAGGPTSFTLELPTPAPASTGTLQGLAPPGGGQPVQGNTVSALPVPPQENAQHIAQPGFVRGGPNVGANTFSRGMPPSQQPDGAPQGE